MGVLPVFQAPAKKGRELNMHELTLAHTTPARRAWTACAALGLLAFPTLQSPAQAITLLDDRATAVIYSQSPYAGRVEALQTFRRIDLRTDDIYKVLPLMTELRNCDRQMWADTSLIESEMLVHKSSAEFKVEPGTAIELAKQRCNERKARIWSKTTEKIGAAKADALRNLVEPQRHEVDRTQVSEGIHRMDALLAQWDEQTKQRLAATQTDSTASVTVLASINDDSRARQASLPPEVYYTPPPVGPEELVDLLQERLVNRIASPRGETIYILHNDDLTNSDLWNMWNRKRHIWE
jgi:hypothetical protein